ncbi:PorT family protein [Flavisolibacter sp. BT320]|nr:PorT family protein [Flavisolibacter longurius]
MKKISFLAFFVMVAFAMQAQIPGLGLKGGVNLASWSNNGSSVNYQNRVGFNAGLFANINVSPNFAVQPEVVYSSQGTKYSIGDQDHNLQMNYINIPVMLQAKVGGGLYAQAGPQVGILMDVKDKVDDIETGFFSKDDFKSTDVSLGFGLGYSGVSPIGFDARYNLGLTNINEAGTNKIKNNVLQIGLTYKFGRGY